MDESRADTSDLRVCGEAILYRLFDVGYGIQLDQVESLLAGSAPERLRPRRGEAQAIQILNPPVTVHLGSQVSRRRRGLAEHRAVGAALRFRGDVAPWSSRLCA